MTNKDITELFAAAGLIAIGAFGKALYDLTKDHTKPPVPKKRSIIWEFESDFITHKSHDMSVEAFVGQSSKVNIKTPDSTGKEARIDSAEFTSTNEAVAKWVPDPKDPDNIKKRILQYVGVGTAEVRVKVDADLDAGTGPDAERFLEDFAAVEVKEREAVGFTLDISLPADEDTNTPELPENAEANKAAQ